MGRNIIDAAAIFLGVLAGVLAIGIAGLLWVRRKVSIIRARLITRVAAGDLTFGGLISAIRVNRHTITTAMVRRRLRIDVDGAVAAVRLAERNGVFIGSMGQQVVDLDQAARSLETLMASMGMSGVTPVVLAKAGELGITAHHLRRAAEKAMVSMAVPHHDVLTEEVADEFGHPTGVRVAGWRLLAR